MIPLDAFLSIHWISIETPSFACMLRKTGLCRVSFRTHFDASTIGSHTHTQYSCYTMNLKISARKCQQKPCLQLLPGSQMFESLEMALPQEACWRVEICCMRYFNVSPKLVKRKMNIWKPKTAAEVGNKNQEPAIKFAAEIGRYDDMTTILGVLPWFDSMLCGSFLADEVKQIYG